MIDRLSPILQGKRVVVRLPTEHDASLIAGFIRSARTRYEPPLPERGTDARYWRLEARRVRDEYLSGESFRCFIFSAATQEVLGSIALARIQRGVRYDCSLSYALDIKNEGQGLMHEAAELVISFAFGQLGLHRVEANCRPDNQRSRRLLERLGFKSVGVIEQFVFFEGTWIDATLFSLINPHWVFASGQA